MGEKKTGKLRAAVSVLRLIGIAPGILFRSVSAFRRFKSSYVKAAAAEGLPESLARELADQLAPTSVVRDMIRKQRGER